MFRNDLNNVHVRSCGKKRMVYNLLLTNFFYPLTSVRHLSPKKHCKTLNSPDNNTAFKRISSLLIVLPVCFLFFSIFCSGIASAATTVYVGTDSTSGTVNYQCDGTNDQIEINKALDYIDNLGGGTVYLRGSGTYWIDDTIYIGANTVLTGDAGAEIKLVSHAGWSSDKPLISNTGSADDITITGFTIDGNSEYQGVSLGKGYYNLIYFVGADNTEVSDMRLEWGCGDGLKIKKSKNIKFINNDVYNLGHDALYAMGCSNVEHAYNTICTRTNSACRYSDGCTDSTIHDNLIYSSLSGGSTGPAIQIGTSSTSNCVFDDIEIYNNRIHSVKGAGIWMSANYQDNVIHAQDVYIHNNIFTKVGQYSSNTGFSNAAIVLGDFDNTVIENNVFDDGGHAAIKYFLRSGRRQQQTQFTTYVRNNIIMNCDGVSSITGSGVGIWNTNPTYSTFVVQNNDFYNNKNDQTYGGGFSMSNNLNVNPLCADQTNSALGSRDYHLQSKAGRYSNGKIVADSVSSPLIDAGYYGSSYSKEPSPNGGRINIGRYGNTVQASRSGTTISNQLDYPPVPSVTLDSNTTGNLTVSFNASNSTDDYGIVSYSWDFDASNGISADANGTIVNNTYRIAGTYIVTLTLTDTSGQESSNTLQISVGNANTSIISSETTTDDGDDPTFDIGNDTTDEPVYDILFPVHDDRLRASLPDMVLNNSTYIDVGKRSSASRDLMLFNLTMYNKTDILSNATLSLYWYYPYNTTRQNDTTVEIYRPFAWDPKFVSWNRQNSTSAWNISGGNWFDHNGTAQGNDPYSSLTFAAANVSGNRYYDFDVTQLVQEYINGSYNNTGFFLKARNESENYIAFYSSDWSNESQRPKLTTTVDKPPVANAGPDMVAIVGENTTFNGSLSTDDNGNLSYSWDFDLSDGRNIEATGMTVTKQYPFTGNYTASLIVTDSRGQKSSDTVDVVVREPPVTTSLTPTYDNRLRESSAASILSTSKYLDIGKNVSRSRDLIWFNLSSYNSTDTIYNATLSLYWYYPENTTRTNDTILEIYRPADLSPERRLTGTKGQGLATYRELMQHLSTLTRPEGSALESILQKWISSLQSSITKARGFSPGDPEIVDAVSSGISEVLIDLSEMAYGFAFSSVIEAYWRGMKTGDENLKQASLRWLRGEFTTKTEARQYLSVDCIIDDQSWYEFLKLFAVFVAKTGYKGLLLFLDEGVNLYKITHKQARDSNYEKILTIFNDTMQGKARYIGVFLSGTPQFIYDERRGLFNYEALRSRLADNRFGAQGFVDYTSPVIKLNQLSVEEIYVLLQRLCELHGAYYTYSCPFGEKELIAFINTVIARLGADQLLTPREITRDFLGLLNILHQNPNLTFDMLITERGFSVNSAELNPEDVSIKDDDLFAEFDI